MLITSDPSNYYISLVFVDKIQKAQSISALFKYLTSYGIHLGEQDYFHLSRSTNDMLKVIIESVYQNLDKTNVARIVTLNISKMFDGGWYADLLRKSKT